VNSIIHVSRPVERQLKMNVQGNQTMAKRQKMLKKFENSLSSQTPMGSVMTFPQEILTENLNMRRTAPSTRQHACPNVPENHRVYD
jgi:hypothetical protein